MIDQQPSEETIISTSTGEAPATDGLRPHLKRTALAAVHERLGATFTDFGGWDMPLRYGSELAEHRAVREAAGLFDLSHMGELRVEGAEAAVFLNTALVGDLAALRVGKAKYSLVCDEHGGIVDDVIVYRLGPERFLVVPNAGNTPAVARAFAKRAEGFDATLTDETSDTALIAVQGPLALEIVRELVSGADRDRLTELGYYAALELEVFGVPVLVARTGYTGEDGFELFAPNEAAVELWKAVMRVGEPHGLTPAGLAARDSLRLEAGMPLYGNELGLDTTPAEVGLSGVVSFAKPERFVGRDALEAERDAPPSRILVGLTGLGRRAGRAGYAVRSGDREIGRITSGQPSPTLGTPIALASVDREFAEPGTEVIVDLRGRDEPFRVVPMPFYRRNR